MTASKNSKTQTARWRLVRVLAIGLAALSAVVLAACGGDDDVPPRPEGITFREAQSVLGDTPKAKLERQLGEPILVQGSTENSPGGCFYYALEGEPLHDVWAYCFDKRDEVYFSASLRSPNQPDAPEGVSPVREVLIARADSVCQAEYGRLKEITDAVSKALDAYAARPTGPNRDAVGRQIGKFIDNIEDTHARLSAFEAPEDGLETLTSYLDLLQAQIDTLSEARAAFLDGDLKAYNRLGDEFTEIGQEAKSQAEAYGFNGCSASKFG